MEKYSQFRDRATGIAPFLPVSTPVSALATFTHAALFLFRLPFFIAYFLGYFLFFHFLPLPVIFRKVALWGLMAIPGIWWVDLQLDGVKRGTLADQPRERFPHPGSVIAANFSSPIDAIYLAAIFDPIFTISYPDTRKVQRVSLLGAVLAALSPVRLAPLEMRNSSRSRTFWTATRARLSLFSLNVVPPMARLFCLSARASFKHQPTSISSLLASDTRPPTLRHQCLESGSASCGISSLDRRRAFVCALLKAKSTLLPPRPMV